MSKKRPIGKPFQPGHPGGPGRPKHPPEIKMIKKLTKEKAIMLLNKFLDWPLSELQAYLKDTSNPVLEYYIAKLIYTGLIDGSTTQLNLILDRLLGKVVDKVEISKPVPTVIELIGENKKIVLGTEEKIEDVEPKLVKESNENNS